MSLRKFLEILANYCILVHLASENGRVRNAAYSQETTRTHSLQSGADKQVYHKLLSLGLWLQRNTVLKLDVQRRGRQDALIKGKRFRFKTVRKQLQVFEHIRNVLTFGNVTDMPLCV